MSSKNYVVGVDCKRILQEAVDKHLPLKITNKQGCRWEVYKSNFLLLQSNRLLLTMPSSDNSDGFMEPVQGQEVAVSFKKGYHKCVFVTRVIDVGRHELEKGISTPAVTILAPEQLEKIQRRVFNRTLAPTDEPVTVNFTKVEQQPNNPRETYQGHLHDLSAGGIGVIVDHDDMPDIEEGDQLNIWFVPWQGQEPIRSQVRFRHATNMPESNRQMLGLQMLGLEMTEEGRNTIRRIGRIVSVYQRQKPICEHKSVNE